jgi:Co/Zn/Cd efflux system component
MAAVLARRVPHRRNDALGNVLVIAAAVVTGLWWASYWPDLIAG